MERAVVDDDILANSFIKKVKTDLWQAIEIIQP
jgi:hypothetical protein